MAEYFKIGKLAASSGLKGDIILQHSLGKPSPLKGLKEIFIEEKNGSFIPYFIESAKLRSDSETIIKIEGIDSMEEARKITPTEVWLSEENFNQYKAAAAPIALLGYELMDAGKSLGRIIEVIEQPHQMLCTILYKGKEALIPIHADNLLEMDQKNKKLHVEIPMGLLDIYE